MKAPYKELPFRAYVPEAHPERQAAAQTNQQKWGGFDDHI